MNSTGNGFFLSKGHSYTYKEPAARYGSFKTPSRNIVCGWSVAPDGSASMECGVKSGLKPPPKPIQCDAGDPNDKRVSLRDTGRAAPVLCAGDPGPLLPQIEAKASVLAYGSSTHFGAITCTSATTGLTCRNRDGHGFFLSRAGWRTVLVRYLPGIDARDLERKARVTQLLLDAARTLGETLDQERVYDRFHELLARCGAARRRRRVVVRRA